MKSPFMNEINSTFKYNRSFPIFDISKVHSNCCINHLILNSRLLVIRRSSTKSIKIKVFPFSSRKDVLQYASFILTNLFLDVRVNFTIPCSKSLVKAIQGFHYLMHLICLSWNNVSFRLGHVHFINKEVHSIK